MVPGKKPEGMDPKAKKDFVADFDFEFDEKHKTVSVTERGVAKAERFLGIDHLYRAENGPLVNHLIQALKAESLYKRDVDYAVVDGEVKIIDEFTGRILDGRRWSEGLHQAVEAKEGVRVQEENQTLATITLQNYFRMYDKLAGMTGTALTEATEFMKIYKLPVVQIPTNRPMVRADRTTRSSRPRTASGRPSRARSRSATRPASRCSSGTISVEVSELLSAPAARAAASRTRCSTPSRSTPQREGEIIAEAGRPGAVTIATNMAGRGVDIKLGGNAEHLTQLELAKLGLRPGDPDYDERFADILPADRGARRGGPREGHARPAACSSAAPSATSRAGSTTSCAAAPAARATRASRASSSPPRTTSCACSPATASTASSTASARRHDEGEEEPIEAKMLSKQIENAQRKVEEQNFLIRKRVLEYDDVMNQQREIVYQYRDERARGPRHGRRPRASRSPRCIERLVEEYTPGDYIEEWDLEGLWVAARPGLPASTSAPTSSTARRSTARSSSGCSPRTRMKLYDEREERARRGAHARARALPAAADHRPALARAPLRHGLPARGHPPARVRPDRPARRLQERGASRSSRT